MAINYATQFAPKVAETFAKESLTDSACGNEYTFTGSKTVKLLTVDTVPLGDYQRTGLNRYGQPVELGDVTQEMTMEDDKAFAITIDKGNNLDQMNLKGAVEAMKRQTAQVVVPYIDKYRLKKWSMGAGLVKGYTDEEMEAGLLEAIFDAGAAMDNESVPLTGRTLFLPNRYYKTLALSNQLLGVNSLGEKALAKGVVGEIDGMEVKRVPDNYLPDGVYFLVKWKGATADPVKLQEGKIHKDPPGLSGNLLEGRVYQDSFIIAAKAEGIFAAVRSELVPSLGVVVTAEPGDTRPSITHDGDVCLYTVDGSDPRYSKNVTTLSVIKSFPAGTVMKLTCKKNNGFFSPVVSYTY